MESIIKQITGLNDLKDFFTWWPKLCGFFENTLHMSGLWSIVLSYVTVALALILPGLIVKGIWNKIKSF